jgi:hypothetical protein
MPRTVKTNKDLQAGQPEKPKHLGAAWQDESPRFTVCLFATQPQTGSKEVSETSDVPCGFSQNARDASPLGRDFGGEVAGWKLDVI